MKTLVHTYNAIETMSGRTHFTEASMTDIWKILKNDNFAEIDGSILAVNQVTLVRQATGKEYFLKFIIHTLEFSVLWKMKSWIEQVSNASIDDIFAQIEKFRDENRKYESAYDSISPEERERRKEYLKEMRSRLKLDQ